MYIHHLFPKGSLGARINELKQRVIAENPHRYAVAVPRESLHILHLPKWITKTLEISLKYSCVPTDTTRPKKPHEKDGVEYHFVTKQQFDADVLNNKYVSVESMLSRANLVYCVFMKRFNSCCTGS